MQFSSESPGQRLALVEGVVSSPPPPWLPLSVVGGDSVNVEASVAGGGALVVVQTLGQIKYHHQG